MYTRQGVNKMKKSSLILISLVFAAAIISGTYCDSDEVSNKIPCLDDFTDCVNDNECCSQLCIIPPARNKGYCHGDDIQSEYYIAPPTFRNDLCEFENNTSKEIVDNMEDEFGPYNVAFDYYPANTELELTINNITRTVIVNSQHKKGSESSPLLRLSPTVAESFSIGYKGFVPCQFQIPEQPSFIHRLFSMVSVFTLSVYVITHFL